MACTVGEYILRRLRALGVDHIFGVPGDFAMNFFEQIMNSDLTYVGTCNELNAGYAADGYARIRGLGALAVTHAVGELSALNAVAGAYAEYVPVVLISSAPNVCDILERPLLHHTLGDYAKPMRMFQMITCDAVLLMDARTAPTEIDRVLATALAQKRPVYLGLPGDVALAPCSPPSADSGWLAVPERTSAYWDAVTEAATEAAALLNSAKEPVIVVDLFAARHGVEHELRALLDRSGYPCAALLLGKGVVDEHHPQYIGLYSGQRSREYVRRRVEEADCTLLVGAYLTDFNTGSFTAVFQPGRCIQIDPHATRIRRHVYPEVGMMDILRAITERLERRDPRALDIVPASAGCIHRPDNHPSRPPSNANAPMTVKYLFDRIASTLPDRAIVLADTGQCLFSAAETMLPNGGTFIGQSYYAAIGYALPATLGVCVADPTRPVFLFVGDGAFQVTAQELSTLMRVRAHVSVVVLNNDGYLIERIIVDNRYNDIARWTYHALPAVFEPSRTAFSSTDVWTEADLERTIVDGGLSGRAPCSVVEVHTDRWDCSETLRTASVGMAARLHTSKGRARPVDA